MIRIINVVAWWLLDVGIISVRIVIASHKRALIISSNCWIQLVERVFIQL